MRKLCLLAAILLFSACTGSKEQVFVNPLFHRTLHALGENAWDVTLTPTQIIRQCPWPGKEDWREVYPCVLSENSMDRVTFYCQICTVKGQCSSDYLSFELRPRDNIQRNYEVLQKSHMNSDGIYEAATSLVILD